MSKCSVQGIESHKKKHIENKEFTLGYMEITGCDFDTSSELLRLILGESITCQDFLKGKLVKKKKKERNPFKST